MDCEDDFLPRFEMMRILSERRIIVDESFEDQRLMDMINKLAPLGQRTQRHKKFVPERETSLPETEKSSPERETPNSKRKLEDFDDRRIDCVKVQKILFDISYKRSSEGETDFCFKRMRISG
ncbi:hypothetical protein ACFFRR_002638 [Megaselia abdita]